MIDLVRAKSEGVRMRPKISVVIIGKNEEKNVKDCLGSVSGWADEIVFIDDFSSDRTLELVKQEEKVVVFQRKMNLEGVQRNFAASKAANDWVMILDCDERATEEVKKEIDELFDRKDEKEVGFWIPQKAYLGDYWMKWGGWSAPHLRLYDRRYVSWSEGRFDVVHPGIKIAAGYRQGSNLRNPLIHYNYTNLENFVYKVNRLSILEAIKWYLDGRKMSIFRGFRRYVDRFFRRYIRKKGYKDGYYGFAASFLSGFYELIAYSKYREIIRKGYYLEENGITEDIVAELRKG